ncbi:ABC transporter substrate-binding protein, partial [Mesorhizobium sp. M7A.T.Ca.TU.009.01.1.2]
MPVQGEHKRKEVAVNDTSGRRDFLKLGMAGLATAG